MDGLRIGARQGLRLELDQAEVEDLQRAVQGEEQVLGLEVAVDDLDGVGCRCASGELKGQLDGLFRGQGTPFESPAQSLPLQDLGDHERKSLVRSDVVDREDVRVSQSRCGARFLLEPAQSIFIRCRLRGENLDRHIPAQSRILGAVDLAHGSGTQGLLDDIGSERRSALETHKRDSSPTFSPAFVTRHRKRLEM
jgi:hypothetical protein